MPKKSTGKVKLRRVNGMLMMTIPKTIQSSVEQLADKTFEAAYTQTEGVDVIIFTRKRYKTSYAK